MRTNRVVVLMALLLAGRTMHAQEAPPSLPGPAFHLGVYGDYHRTSRTIPDNGIPNDVLSTWNIDERSGFGIGAVIQIPLTSGPWALCGTLRVGYGTYPVRISEQWPDSTARVSGPGRTRFSYSQVDAEALLGVYPFGSGLAFTFGPSVGIPVEAILESSSGITVGPERTDVLRISELRLAANAGIRYDVDMGIWRMSPHVTYSAVLNDENIFASGHSFHALRAGIDVMVGL